jgi:DNA-binding transcriptional ArsR family regulator
LHQEHAAAMDQPGGPGVGDAEDVVARRDVALEWLERADPAGGDWEQQLSPVLTVVVDALLHADTGTLRELAEPLRRAAVDLGEGPGEAREMHGYLIALLDSIRLALNRLPDPGDFALAQDSHAGQMLEALSRGVPLTSAELRERLGTSDSHLSRVGRTLLAAGLVVQRRAGRVAIWELTPRGRQVLHAEAERRGQTLR